ncbi:EAL domain-containing protein [Paraglaciecola sp. MB-3u-78]|uniref:EAL domain-containing protein n=1 Tax=Paraglaciecola sp. MB-3u-78 TaxID=2058332 RepID=UPI001E3439DE|nr:EAL domain-containing protein [Paraglaciecola sp. MB-3u-78]
MCFQINIKHTKLSVLKCWICSLSYLKQVPADIIKIDRRFVSGMSDNSAYMQIVLSTIAMVQKLGMQGGQKGKSQLK